MLKLCVLLLPAMLLAAGNLVSVTVLPPESAVSTGVLARPAPPAPAGTDEFIPFIGTVDTVGGTTHDWQVNGPSVRSLVRCMVGGVEKGLHAGWMYSTASDTSFPDRNMRYNYYDDSIGAWRWTAPDFMQSGVNVFADRSGYGNLANDPSTGRAVFSRHYGTGQLQVGAAADVAAGAGTFEYSDGPAGYVWPAIDVGTNGWMHTGCMDASGQGVWYSRCTTWSEWSSPSHMAVPTFPTHNIGASKVSRKVAVGCVIFSALGEQMPAYYRTSEDGGTSWSPRTRLDYPPAFGGDTVTSFHVSAMYPFYDRKRDKLHIAVAVHPIVNDTDLVLPAEIWHFCPDNSPQWTRVHRAGTGHLLAPVGSNAIYACRPSIGEDQYGGLYVAFEQFDSSNYEPGPPPRARADIFYARDNGDNGASWQQAVKVTTPGTWTCRFPSAVDYFTDDTFRITYIVDTHAGFFQYGEGGATLNPVVVHKIPVSSGIRSEPEKPVLSLQLVVGPNPFSGRTELRYTLPKTGNIRLEVFDLAGRSVAKPVEGHKTAGRYSATFDACNMAPGIYVARIETNGQSMTRKLMLAR